MRQSKLFTKTKKEAPTDEVSKNAELLIRGGFINKEMAGVYSYLPLGLRVLKNIENIIREEVNAIGGQEIVMTALQNPELWKKTDRFDDEKVDIWFKTKLKNDTELGLGFTHEEPLTNIMKNYISSYRDLPCFVYQFQTKFRNETRAKSGIMRTREFVMKDLYSFSRDEHEHNEFYEKAKIAYKNIFKRVGIGHLTYLTFASGGSFSKFSHEFQTISSTGEDTIYINEENNIAINKEVFTDEIKKDLGLGDNFKETKAVEVGNIFTLGTRFSDVLDLKYQTETGESRPVFMGSYGIGPGRLMGTVVEALSDDKGIIWPESIAPFKVHLLSLSDNEDVKKEANFVYDALIKENIEVLFDDRNDLSPGEKFADADLLGIPFRLVISSRSMKEKGIEIKKRNEEKGKIVSLDELINILKTVS
ncbi:MAG: Prolyl-tRNA synthetase [Candidatus Nomurabacteria bacterium GW2011_GWE1_32_28]|uniref:Proline--tRNA ligase n=1 Tax=Candidatus Nomurabacteria bacterium GW2011_GWF1_31_48 TaxID=1618767 RepID=A0A0F9YFN3_9BACT|nr:MAG: Prolyl-tRNA synthetase [Candidatus Nomurabacteria bacterium GW2011_GWF2_30_133]KKP28602.1 MAG: Prolyl-tRNA synthetase [Candidatus Nomurabacteria bacterium GW2011_GWE2_31_40]KKP30178.1 MAG: Prolyl-tRNA synthetase [Candidatus Nomurabacteria bacterium GW2011_GWF1_31_48]KKP34704.1 MAG: Prolyl-tRNA synthetase [Candidatus Nomurabacteria bacterium GW2011_GWE1_32_28]HAS80837.1 prolyl-tRNA synthetase [Candidatus Nomurabacteria bacterium]